MPEPEEEYDLAVAYFHPIIRRYHHDAINSYYKRDNVHPCFTVEQQSFDFDNTDCTEEHMVVCETQCEGKRSWLCWCIAS